MERYVLNKIKLRSWWFLPCTCIRDEGMYATKLDEESFAVLKRCDGIQMLEETDTVKRLLEQKMIRKAEEGETTEENRLWKHYENRYMPGLHLTVTTRCNFNCIHCFEAEDSDIKREEMSLEDCRKLLEEAKNCGVQFVVITGGEPMVHPHFMEIIRSVYENDMKVRQIYTNGFYLNEEKLRELKAIDPGMRLNISYDGKGYHDWMRGVKGAEKNLLEKIRMCVQAGFPVRVCMTINRINKDCAKETLDTLEELGVQEFRIIRTSETPRWKLNAGDACLTFEEYYDAMIDLLRDYAKGYYRINLNLWKFVSVYPQSRWYAMEAVQADGDNPRPSQVMCTISRYELAVFPGGQVYPCSPISGTFDAYGHKLENIFETGMKELLQDSRYLRFVCQSCRKIAEHDRKCSACFHFPQCLGGCRTVALVVFGDLLAHDELRCLFYEKKYYRKIREILTGYRTQFEVREPED
ncbi:MAG: radical SAM protein [Solobacterium sp.]|nr:radical SAM protein [Solobacterium sp.]